MARAPLGMGVIVLILFNVVIWAFVFSPQTHVLTVSFLDVRQGDAILIQSPTGTEVLVDGGPDRSVLRELGKRIGPFDRSIDMVVETHPDADHITGLSDVFARYQVGAFLSSRIENDTNQTYALLDAVRNESGVRDVLARRGERIWIGGGAYIDVLFPDRDVSHVETNTGSVILRVVYGDTEFMLTGDSPEAIEDYVVSLGEDIESDVLKAGHHGSRTSTGNAFLAAVHPKIVVISAGKGNSYGHPHEETLARIQTEGAKILSTLGQGAVVLISDGQTIIQK